MAQHQSVDWSSLPQPEDDGACAHLEGMMVPSLSLRATSGEMVDLASLKGTTVLYIYPMTARPDRPLPDGWEAIPGARGCTPQSCSFRDHFAELRAQGADHLFGLSTQLSEYQQEAAERLHLPFPLLSDEDRSLAAALQLPTFEFNGKVLIKRVTLIIKDGQIRKSFYPVFPPDRNPADVIAWLADRQP